MTVGGTSLSLNRQAELQRLIGTTAILVASDGDVSAANFTGGVAASVEQNNRQMHLEEIKWAESNAEEFQEWLCRNESQCLSLDEAQATLLLELNRRVSDDFRSLPENETAAAFISSQAPSGILVDGQSLFADLSQGRSEEYLNSTINMREFGTIAESLALVDQFGLAPGYATFTAAQGIDGDLYAYFDTYGRSDLTQFILANKGMSDTMSAQAGMLLNAVQSGMIPPGQVGETLDLVSELEGLSAGFRNVNVHAMVAGRQNGLLSLNDLYFGDGTEEGAAVVQAFGQSLQGLAISNAVVMRTLGMQTPTTNRSTLLQNAQNQLDELSISLSGQRNPPATAIGAIDPKTGKVVTATSGDVPTTIHPQLQQMADELGGLGVRTSYGNVLGRCAEFRAANELLLNNPRLNLSDIDFTPAVRPRTGQIIQRCDNCVNVFGAE